MLHIPRKLHPHQINELRPEFVGVHALNPGLASNSASRSTMTSSHLSQHIVHTGLELPSTIAGPEVRYKEHTIAARVQEDCVVIATVDRYPRSAAAGGMKINPDRFVIVQNSEDHTLDVLVLSHFTSMHQYFGYRNVWTDDGRYLPPGTFLAKDTVLTDTPANKGDFYTFTRNMNVALISEAGVAEDGVVICEDVLPLMSYFIYERRTATVGSRKFPVSMGKTADGENKWFPEIGDITSETGEIMRLREHIEGLSPVQLSRRAVETVDYTFDEALYGRQQSGRVVDVLVIGNTDGPKVLPPAMSGQFERYRTAFVRFNEELLKLEARLIRENIARGGDGRLKIAPDLHRMLVDARAYTNHARQQHGGMNLQLLQNKNPVDEYQISFVIEYEIIPDIGAKVTGISGDKGVITGKLPRHRMPRDKEGNVADIVMAADATVARTNFARQYIMYANGAARTATGVLRDICGLGADCSFEQVEYMPDDQFQKAWEYLMGYYERINPPMVDVMQENLSGEKKRLHVYECLVDRIRNLRGVDCPKPWTHAVADLEAYVPQCYDVVTHQMIEDGKTETTKDRVRIADMGVILLDKAADDVLSVGTAAHGVYGVLVKHNHTDRYTKPFKDSPPRTNGESEARAYAAHSKTPEMSAEMMDRNNSPVVQLAMAREVVSNPTPGNIPEIVNRDEYPFGETKPIQIAANMFQSFGVRLKYVPEDMDPHDRPTDFRRR